MGPVRRLAPPAALRLLRVAGLLRAGVVAFAARLVLVRVPFRPEDFPFLAGLVGRFLAVFLAAVFFRAAFRAFFGTAFFLVAVFFAVFFFETFFLAAAFLEAFFAAFFLAFFTTGLRRARLGRVALALVFLVAAFLTGIAFASKPEFEKRAIIPRPEPSGSLQAAEFPNDA